MNAYLDSTVVFTSIHVEGPTAGTDSETGMPVGVQLLAPALAEAELLSAAQTLTR